MNCVYIYGLKAPNMFIILPSQDGFEIDCPVTKFQTITFQIQFRSSGTQMFFKIGVLKNFATVKHLCGSLF